jgi:hypothetical protein
MKKILLIAIMAIFTTGAFATSTSVFKASQDKFIVSNDTATYKLDLGNVTKLDKKEIESKIDSFLKKNLKNVEDNELTCTVEVSGTVSYLGQSVTLKVTVSGPCDELLKAGKKVAQMVFVAIKAALKS